MATIFLNTLNTLFGSDTPTGLTSTSLAKIGGSVIADGINSTISSRSKATEKHGARLQELHVQTTGYDSVIARAYGTVRLAGNIIWTSKLHEHKHTNYVTSEVKGDVTTHSTSDYVYTISLAIAICEGPINGINKFWINDKLINKTELKYRAYLGTEIQTPDHLMELDYGIGGAPAYRGTAYVVFENFNITNFGNKLPTFTFEITKSCDDNAVENNIDAVVIGPGYGEFVYDTVTQMHTNTENIQQNGKIIKIKKGNASLLNQYHSSNMTDAVSALEQLKETLPSIKWISVIIQWFATDVNISSCKIVPGAEHSDLHSITEPDEWNVAGVTRDTAYVVSRDTSGVPRCGGTVNDASLVRFLHELKKRGYNIMLCPTLFVDIPGKSWSGNISGTAHDVHKFFIEQYNEFILHYAKLCSQKIDAFLIGNELSGILKIYEPSHHNKYKDDKKNNRKNDKKSNWKNDEILKNITFPAINEMKNLADEARKYLGCSTKISYAATWREYHHIHNKWYALDELWSAQNIDFIGINAYFPLTEWKHHRDDIMDVINGFDGGEGYDFIYNDNDNSDGDYKKNDQKQQIDKKYAWKNIKWWWENEHINPNGAKTSWTPMSKKIWFTKYGFASINLSTNDPHVTSNFYEKSQFDEKSRQYPRYSDGKKNISAQRIGIEAMQRRWMNSDMVENKFLAMWDARPYPTWPMQKNIWRDTDDWDRGHSLQGKLGRVTLSNVLQELCCLTKLNNFIKKSKNNNFDNINNANNVNNVNNVNNINNINNFISNIDVSQISSIFTGFAIRNQITVREIIEMLQHAYSFDVVESEYKIKFIPKGNGNIRNIFKDEIVKNVVQHNVKANHKQSINEIDNSYTIAIANTTNIPRRVDVNFLDVNFDCNINNQYAEQHTIETKNDMHINLPLAMDGICAADIAHNILTSLLLERYRYNFILSTKHINIEPTDIIILSEDSQKFDKHIHVIKVINTEITNNNKIVIHGIAEDLSVYTNIDFYQTHFGQSIIINKPIIQIDALNIPSIYEKTNDDNVAKIMISAYSLNEFWHECFINVYASLNTTALKEKSLNINNTHNKKIHINTKIIQQQATIGAAANILSAHSSHIVDNKNEVTIILQNGELHSITHTSLYDGVHNIAILGEEIIKFRKAQCIASNKYIISGILRGLFGTEQYISQHKIGERFALLNTYTTFDIPSKYFGYTIYVEVDDSTYVNSYKYHEEENENDDELFDKDEEIINTHNTRHNKQIMYIEKYIPQSIIPLATTQPQLHINNDQYVITWNKKDRSFWAKNSDMTASFMLYIEINNVIVYSDLCDVSQFILQNFVVEAIKSNQRIIIRVAEINKQQHLMGPFTMLVLN